MLIGCSTVISTKWNTLCVTNKALTIGYRYETERPVNDDSKLTSFLHIGVPIWLDGSGQMQSYLSFSPLLMASETLCGLQIAPIAGIEQGKGMQCALFGTAKSFDGLLLSPISIVYEGNCLQVGLLAISGVMWRGLGTTLGQISVVNLASRCPFQLGCYNGEDMHFHLDKNNNFCQVGFWNTNRVFEIDEHQNREIRDESKIEESENRLLSTMTQCGFVNKTESFLTLSSNDIIGNQLGLVNLAYRVGQCNGQNYQWGLINYSDSDNKNIMQIGLINIKGHRFMLLFNK